MSNRDPRVVAVFTVDGTELEVVRGIYATGHTALTVRSAMSHEPEAVLSINLPDEALDGDCIWLKEYTENASITQHVLLTGCLEPTGEITQAGQSMVQAYRIVEVDHE